MLTPILAILAVFIGCFVISIVVFGGAQMFIPYFKILLVNILNIDQNTWDSVLSISNSTPGVFGLKIAFISGFLAANGNWWGWLLMFGTYAIFAIVPIGLMLLIFNKYKKSKTSKFMTSFIKMMRPVLAGILVSIIVNLGLSITLPFVGFNDIGTNMGELDKYLYLKNEKFFREWRYWALLAWSLISIPTEYFIVKKYKINTIYMILINIAICMLIFQPWLYTG
ncbi:MAG: hypothetical protein HDR43_01855 [Mycoplasma sp.]|nr:hypothetical protein [Mycoplasma sp.]